LDGWLSTTCTRQVKSIQLVVDITIEAGRSLLLDRLRLTADPNKIQPQLVEPLIFIDTHLYSRYHSHERLCTLDRTKQQNPTAMDALLASAGPIPEKSHNKPKPRRALPHQKVNRGAGKDSIDSSLHSILPQTRLAPSLHSHLKDVQPSNQLSKIKDKKLRAKLASEQVSQKRARGEREDVQTYLNNPAVTSYSHAFGDELDDDDTTPGEPMDTGIEVDEEIGEKTWRVSQDEIADAVGISARTKKFDLKLETIGDGGYSIDYTRNGR
jgi:hypothetical protein